MEGKPNTMGIELNGRIAVISGGANGIGYATARTFAQAGAKVVIWDYAAEAGEAAVSSLTADGGEAVFHKVNVASPSDTEAAAGATIAQFGRIDILINNAGICRDAQLVKVKGGDVVGKLSEADWDAVIAVNLKGVFNCTQAVAPYMIQQRYGRIVNAASVVALHGNFGQTNYVASKAGVIGMTKVWSRELGKRGVTVNAIAPGFIATEMTKGMPEQVLGAMVEHTPVGRIGQPQDVANAYLFLASDEASFVNGAVLSVDGGLVLGT